MCILKKIIPLSKKQTQFQDTFAKVLFQIPLAGNTLKIQNVYWILCQYSSAWLEHQICNLRVVGSDPIIGFLNFIKITSKE